MGNAGRFKSRHPQQRQIPIGVEQHDLRRQAATVVADHVRLSTHRRPRARSWRRVRPRPRTRCRPGSCGTPRPRPSPPIGPRRRPWSSTARCSPGAARAVPTARGSAKTSGKLSSPTIERNACNASGGSGSRSLELARDPRVRHLRRRPVRPAASAPGTSSHTSSSAPTTPAPRPRIASALLSPSSFGAGRSRLPST